MRVHSLIKSILRQKRDLNFERWLIGVVIQGDRFVSRDVIGLYTVALSGYPMMQTTTMRR